MLLINLCLILDYIFDVDSNTQFIMCDNLYLHNGQVNLFK